MLFERLARYSVIYARLKYKNRDSATAERNQRHLKNTFSRDVCDSTKRSMARSTRLNCLEIFVKNPHCDMIVYHVLQKSLFLSDNWMPVYN